MGGRGEHRQQADHGAATFRVSIRVPLPDRAATLGVSIGVPDTAVAAGLDDSVRDEQAAPSGPPLATPLPDLLPP